jgi:hypothetical protein
MCGVTRASFVFSQGCLVVWHRLLNSLSSCGKSAEQVKSKCCFLEQMSRVWEVPVTAS